MKEIVMDEQLLRRIRGEFTEMPGLLLTVAQAKRLWHLDERTCLAALSALVESHFLVERRNGSFTRAAEGQSDARSAMARAHLPKIHRAS
jgi:Fic family protein